MTLEVTRRLAGDRASDTILHGGIGRLLDDALRDLGVRVTALVQRAACECSDACCGAGERHASLTCGGGQRRMLLSRHTISILDHIIHSHRQL
jgi:hypothetical protein